MIVVTVGTQLPFDRLIEMVDHVAPTTQTDFFAQIGKGRFQPKNIAWCADVDPTLFDEMLRDASVIIAHAGIGTVLKAYKYKKPIILVPRRAKLGEHRNDHQLATVAQLRTRPGIFVADTDTDLSRLLSTKLEPVSHSEDALLAKKAMQEFIAKTAKTAIVKR